MASIGPSVTASQSHHIQQDSLGDTLPGAVRSSPVISPASSTLKRGSSLTPLAHNSKASVSLGPVPFLGQSRPSFISPPLPRPLHIRVNDASYDASSPKPTQSSTNPLTLNRFTAARRTAFWESDGFSEQDAQATAAPSQGDKKETGGSDFAGMSLPEDTAPQEAPSASLGLGSPSLMAPPSLVKKKSSGSNSRSASPRPQANLAPRSEGGPQSPRPPSVNLAPQPAGGRPHTPSRAPSQVPSQAHSQDPASRTEAASRYGTNTQTIWDEKAPPVKRETTFCGCCKPKPFQRAATRIDDVVENLEANAKQCGCCCECACGLGMTLWTILGFVPKAIGFGLSFSTGLCCAIPSSIYLGPDWVARKCWPTRLVELHPDECCVPVRGFFKGTCWVAVNNFKSSGMAVSTIFGDLFFGTGKILKKIGRCAAYSLCFCKPGQVSKLNTTEGRAEIRDYRVGKSSSFEKRYYQSLAPLLAGKGSLFHEDPSYRQHQPLHVRVKNYVMGSWLMDAFKCCVGSKKFEKRLTEANQKTGDKLLKISKKVVYPGSPVRNTSSVTRGKPVLGFADTRSNPTNSPSLGYRSRLAVVTQEKGDEKKVIVTFAPSAASPTARTHDGPFGELATP